MDNAVRLRQLEYFVAVADSGSITAAAASLLVAQPSLSLQIRGLERELGAKLFERLPRGIRLTPAGRALLEHARATLNAAALAVRRVREVENGEAGELHIGTIRSLSAGLLPSSIARWHRTHRSVSLLLREFGHTDELEHAVRSGYGDIGVGPAPRQPFPTQVDLGEEEFAVVLPPDDELARAATIDLGDLRDRPWALFAPDHGLSDVINQACRKHGFTPRGAVHTHQVEAAIRLAAAGLGPTLVPRNTIPPGLDAAIRPPREPLRRRLCAYSREPFSALASGYVDHLRESVQDRAYL